MVVRCRSQYRYVHPWSLIPSHSQSSASLWNLCVFFHPKQQFREWFNAPVQSLDCWFRWNGIQIAKKHYFWWSPWAIMQSPMTSGCLISDYQLWCLIQFSDSVHWRSWEFDHSIPSELPAMSFKDLDYEFIRFLKKSYCKSKSHWGTIAGETSIPVQGQQDKSCSFCNPKPLHTPLTCSYYSFY